MNTELGQWLLEMIRSQGLGTVIVLGACAFIWKKVWPAIVDQIIPVWQEATRAKTRLMERQVLALERIDAKLPGSALISAEAVRTPANVPK